MRIIFLPRGIVVPLFSIILRCKQGRFSLRYSNQFKKRVNAKSTNIQVNVNKGLVPKETEVLSRSGSETWKFIRANCASTLAMAKGLNAWHISFLIYYYKIATFKQTLWLVKPSSLHLRLALLRTSFVFLKIPACLYNSTMHEEQVFYFFNSENLLLINFNFFDTKFSCKSALLALI